MENVYEKMVELYDAQKGKRNPIRVRFKEPIVLKPFCPRVKTNKKYDSDGMLIGYTLGRKPKKEYILYLYVSVGGTICFSNKATRVSNVYPNYVLFKDSEVESMEILEKESKDDIDWDFKNRDYILNNLHENMWDNIKDRLRSKDFREEGFLKENSGRKIKTASMKSIFPEWVLRNIKNAIETKSDYRYSRGGTRRDKSIEIKMCEDGILRGWYSSEYSGTGNGDYYLLINERTAIFCETD